MKVRSMVFLHPFEVLDQKFKNLLLLENSFQDLLISRPISEFNLFLAAFYFIFSITCS